jgi:arginyl-tRNA synthetase
MHIAKWIWCYQNYHKNEKLRDDEDWIARIYVDAVKRLAEKEEFQAQVDEINRKIESKEDKEINELWEKTRALSIKSWEKIYSQLGTHFDAHYFESEVELEGKKEAESLLKEGIAVMSDDAVIIDLKEYNLGVWVLLRKDGTVLYSAKDLALAIRKVKEFKADRYIVIVGDEQRLHFQQLVKTLGLMKFEKAKDYGFITFGMVRLPTGKMSSRTGDNILYSSFMEEVLAASKEEIKKRFPEISEKELEGRALAISISAIKYSMLKQDSNRAIVFNKEEAISFEGDTGPYLQYSYARASSILRKAEEAKRTGKKIKIIDIADKELGLIKKLLGFPEISDKAARDFAPNLIANYAYTLAQTFNEFYHSSQVIGSKEQEFRLMLVKKFRIVMKQALSLLGIDVLEEM